MRDLDAQIRAYASALAEASEPVTAEEVRRRRHRPLGAVIIGVAAVVLLVAGVSAALLQQRSDDVVIADQGGFGHDLDGHRDWLIAMLNGEVQPDDGELDARFTPAFLEEIPPDEFRRVAVSLRDSAPWSVLVEVERRERSLAVQIVGADEEQARLTLAIDGDGRIEAATVLAARPCGPLVDPESIDIGGPVRERLTWVLDVINSDDPLPDADLAAQFDEAFLADLPVEELRRRIESVRALAPLSLRWYEGEPDVAEVVVRLGISSGEEAVLTMRLAAEEPFRIHSLTVLTEEPCVLRD